MISKKAQMEMIGLVVIVILITLGMLFLAQFALKEKPEKKIFTRKGLAYSTMSSIMKTSVECQQPNGQIVYPEIGKDLIDDCASSRGVLSFCTYQCRVDTEVIDCCTMLDMSIQRLLDQTLGTWNKDYQFRSQSLQGGEPVNIIEVNAGTCPRTRERDSSGLFPIFAGSGGLVENELYLCD